MNDQLRAYLDEQASELDESVRQALSVADGDPMPALRASLIAIDFLQDEIDGLKSQVSTGFTRGRVRKPAPKNYTADEFLAAVAAGTADRARAWSSGGFFAISQARRRLTPQSPRASGLCEFREAPTFATPIFTPNMESAETFRFTLLRMLRHG